MGVLEKARARAAVAGPALGLSAGPTAPPQDPSPPTLGILAKASARGAAAAPTAGGGFMGGLEQVGSHLPTAGAMLGGFMGGGVGPVSRGGASLGAAGGEAFNQLIQHLPGGSEGPSTSADATKRILGAGATGAASQFGGQLLGGGLVAKTAGSTAISQIGLLPKLGRGMMRSAVGRRALESVRKNFPTVDVINTIIRERIPWGRTAGFLGKRGSEIANAKVELATAANQRLIDAADAKGITHSIGDVLDPVYQHAQTLAKSPAGQRKAAEIIKLVDEEYAKYGVQSVNGQAIPGVYRSLTTNELNDTVKRGAQAIGYATKGSLAPDSPAIQQFTRWVAESAQQTLERIPQLGTHIGTTNQRTQALMAARAALELSESRGGAHFSRLAIPLSAMGLGGTVGGFSGGGSPMDRAQRVGAGAALGLTLTHPANVSRTALRLTSPLAPTVSSLMSNLLGGQLSRRAPEPQP